MAQIKETGYEGGGITTSFKLKDITEFRSLCSSFCLLLYEIQIANGKSERRKANGEEERQESVMTSQALLHGA